MPNSLGPDVKPLTIGHVDHGIECTCEERDCVKCLKAIDRRTQSTDECFNCPIADGCSWCSAYNYQVFGTASCTRPGRWLMLIIGIGFIGRKARANVSKSIYQRIGRWKLSARRNGQC